MNQAFLDKFVARLNRIQPEEVQSFLVALAREKGFLETIFNAILEGIIVTDAQGRILYLNHAACSFFGVEAPESLGRDIAEIVRGPDWQALASGGDEITIRDLEVTYPERRALNFYIVPLKDEHGERTASVILLSDITKHRTDTAETIETERLSALALLAASVAHEIGNPLNSLDIHLQLLNRKIRALDTADREDLAETLAVTRQEVARLDKIITQFLQATRPQPPELRPTDLNAVAAESLAFLDAEIRDRDILLETQFAENIPLVEADPDQLKQAFYNIVRNALQATHEGGILRVRTHFDDHSVGISFADTGCGLDPDNANRIFDPYFTTKTKGSGIGLFIVSRIVRAHGGEIAIETAPGKGLTFGIRLPRRDLRIRSLPAE